MPSGLSKRCPSQIQDLVGPEHDQSGMTRRDPPRFSAPPAPRRSRPAPRLRRHRTPSPPLRPRQRDRRGSRAPRFQQRAPGPAAEARTMGHSDSTPHAPWRCRAFANSWKMLAGGSSMERRSHPASASHAPCRAGGPGHFLAHGIGIDIVGLIVLPMSRRRLRRIWISWVGFPWSGR